jgi:hypothetical protein
MDILTRLIWATATGHAFLAIAYIHRKEWGWFVITILCACSLLFLGLGR